uniref:PGG domain-containing protein n=1 Tax=Populus alba TaxID=43335 RepID=A0A4U5QDH1_POPAL|nr:hypothetical protein D5086_0000102840 [Populus alba]
MFPLPIRATPYRAAMNGDWKGMVDHYQERVLDVPLPVTLSADTALHLALYSKQEQPLKDLLEIVKDIENLLPETEFLLPETDSETESPVPETESRVAEIQFLKRKNKFGNTALHEATIYGNYEAARLLVERCPDLLKEKNNYGETPLFTAAGFAETEIVEFLIRSKPEKCVDCPPVKRYHEVKSQVEAWFEERKRSRDLESGQGRNSEDLGSGSEKNQRGGKLQYLRVPEAIIFISRLLQQVQKVIPSHYVTLRNKEGKTADELFKESHLDQLKNAQTWIKETTQSCSTVAALVATVVFAAVYTVPGGSDKNGTPNFINSPYFLVFTVSDVLSLASSLTSLVVFLSLLTSPFELQEFHISLPWKLVGFTFLFFALITTMLSFGATILILMQSEKKLTTLLLSIAAFLPVLVFGITQFRLYVSFMGSTYNILRITGKALPRFLVPCLPWQKKLRRVD